MELALLLPVVVLLLLAVLQVSLLARDAILVAHASREAARAAATEPDPRAAAVAAARASGLDGDRLSVAVTGRAGPGSRVRVEVTYRSATAVPLVGALLDDRTLTVATTMRVEVAASEQASSRFRPKPTQTGRTKMTRR
ncbi:MAG: TadE/TadG family type IV pilus assembly protein [Acidimicrobiales bacterium]|nr:TadE/TadG family type IV pilus assembly protein [Acidimicrobiales bacterium]